MIDRQHGCLIIGCDSCDATYEGDKDSEFEVLWETAKREGWHARKVVKERMHGSPYEWLHGCPKCGVPT